MKFITSFLLFCCCVCPMLAKELGDINIRDPFILADSVSGVYYMYRSSSARMPDGKVRGGVEAFRSRDLNDWEGPVRVMDIPADNALTGSVWAPEVHRYNGRYYMFATVNSDIEWKKAQDGWGKYTWRGTQIFSADTPEGPFVPMGRYVATPMDWMALDGTLWVENGKPYMVFCHEWLQTADGTMEAVELLPDLSAAAGEPQTLFCGSAPQWSTGLAHSGGLPTAYITDGCYLYRTKTGTLLMIWSSFSNGDYAIGVAESVTGSVRGPWRQQEKPLFVKNGGHGMIFKTLDGGLRLVLHQPNSPSGAERARIFELEDTGDTLLLK